MSASVACFHSLGLGAYSEVVKSNPKSKKIDPKPYTPYLGLDPQGVEGRGAVTLGLVH